MSVPGELFAYFLVEDPSVVTLPLPAVSTDRLPVVRGDAPDELTYYASPDALVAGALLTGLTNAVNDAAAAIAGVPVGGIYRNGSVLMVRVS